MKWTNMYYFENMLLLILFYTPWDQDSWVIRKMETMYNDLSFPTFSALKSLLVDDCHCAMFVHNFSGSLKVPM